MLRGFLHQCKFDSRAVAWNGFTDGPLYSFNKRSIEVIPVLGWPKVPRFGEEGLHVFLRALKALCMIFLTFRDASAIMSLVLPIAKV